MTAMNLHRYPSPSGGIALGKMGVGATMLKQGKTARDYVQDGLVAMWDGIENAGWGVHDPNATTWKDLIGSQDMTLSQYGSFSEDALVCAGTEYAASRGEKFQDSIYIEAVVEYDRLERQYGNIVVWGELDGVKGYAYTADLFVYSDTLIQTGGSSVFYSKDASAKSFAIQYVRPNNLGVDTFTYFNGSQLSRYIKTDNWATRYNIGYFGGRQSGYSFKGKIKRVAMYSKVLTADEIAANYAIDKERFNLP